MSRIKRSLFLSQFLSYYPVIKHFDYFCVYGISLSIYSNVCEVKMVCRVQKKKKKMRALFLSS